VPVKHSSRAQHSTWAQRSSRAQHSTWATAHHEINRRVIRHESKIMTTATQTKPANAQIDPTEDEWADMDGFVKFEAPGEYIEGTYLQYIPNESYREGSTEAGQKIKGQFQFINEDGLFKINWSAGLGQLVNVTPGTELKITFVEKQKTSNSFNVKVFRFQVKRAMMAALKEAFVDAAKNGKLVKESSPTLAIEAGDPLTRAGYIAPVDEEESDPFADENAAKRGVAA
jgi:hypothetical protein